MAVLYRNEVSVHSFKWIKRLYFLFLWVFGSLNSKILSFLCWRDAITSWSRHDVTPHYVTKFTSPIPALWCSEMIIQIRFCSFFRLISFKVLSHNMRLCILYNLDDVFFIPWHHDVNEITTWRQETRFLQLNLQMCSKAEFIFLGYFVGCWTQLCYCYRIWIME